MHGKVVDKSERAPFRSWKVGEVTITKFVEIQDVFDITAIFPMATAEALLNHSWLQPHFVTPEGRAILSFHALVVDTPTKRIIVDTCVGNEKNRMPRVFMNNLQTSFLRDLEGEGYARESFDVVICTHLHMDHIGWNTMLVDGVWVPTFPNARYLLDKTEYEYWRAPYDVPTEGGWADLQREGFSDSVKPVVEAGLVDLVEGRHQVCNEVALVPTPGHSPGHVSVRISSQGEEALITGDMMLHPSQLAHMDWVPPVDFDGELARRTRQEVFTDAADRSVLVIGTHWAGASAGRVKRRGNAFCLEC